MINLSNLKTVKKIHNTNIALALISGIPIMYHFAKFENISLFSTLPFISVFIFTFFIGRRMESLKERDGEIFKFGKNDKNKLFITSFILGVLIVVLASGFLLNGKKSEPLIFAGITMILNSFNFRRSFIVRIDNRYIQSGFQMLSIDDIKKINLGTNSVKLFGKRYELYVDLNRLTEEEKNKFIAYLVALRAKLGIENNSEDSEDLIETPFYKTKQFIGIVMGMLVAFLIILFMFYFID